jgi:hypothetical protein
MICCAKDAAVAAAPIAALRGSIFRRGGAAGAVMKRLAAGLVVLALAGQAQAEVLISAQEAGLPESPFKERGSFPGPKVVLVSPDHGAAAVKSPMRLRIRFEPRGAKVDLDSLRVTYIKLQPVDLTERVRASAGVDGIDFKDAEVPPGTHKIRIELRDADGVPGGADIVLKIAK